MRFLFREGNPAPVLYPSTTSAGGLLLILTPPVISCEASFALSTITSDRPTPAFLACPKLGTYLLFSRRVHQGGDGRPFQLIVVRVGLGNEKRTNLEQRLLDP